MEWMVWGKINERDWGCWTELDWWCSNIILIYKLFLSKVLLVEKTLINLIYLGYLKSLLVDKKI